MRVYKRKKGRIAIIFLEALLLLIFAGQNRARATEETLSLERPEFFWQPKGERGGVTLAGIYSQYQFTGTESNLGTQLGPTTTNVQNPSYSAQLYYGLSDQWAVNLIVSTTLSQKTITGPVFAYNNPGTFLTSGPNNLVLGFKNSTPFEKWILHFGANANFSFDINDPANSGSTGDNYTGGDGVTPYIGASWNIFGRSYLGVDFSYAYFDTRIIDPNRSVIGSAAELNTGTFTGTTFFEWHTKPWVFTFAFASNWGGPINAQYTAFNLATIINVNYPSINTLTADFGAEYYLDKNFMVRLDGVLAQIPQFTSTVNFSTTVLTDQVTQNSTSFLYGVLTARDEF
jgi:hypothetical protein